MHLHSRSCGKTVHSVWRTGQFVEIRYTDGTSMKIGWKDDHGELIKGEPTIVFEGIHIRAKSALLGAKANSV